MKKTHLLIASLALFGLISCEKSEETPKAVLPADNVIRVSAGINALTTRAGATTSKLTEFGMFITNNNAGSSAYTFTNAKATRGGTSGSYTWSTDPVMIWKDANEEVSIVAYAPYNPAYTALINNTVTVKTNQSTEEDIIASDFLYAASKVTPSNPVTENDIYYGDQMVTVKLGHHFSKLELIITIGSEFDNLKPSDVLIYGTSTSATINLTDGAITDLTKALNITPSEISYSNNVATYEAIIIPQGLTNSLAIEFEINGKTYGWRSETTLTFEKNRKYTLPLKVGKDGVTLSSMTVGDWQGGADSEIGTK